VHVSLVVIQSELIVLWPFFVLEKVTKAQTNSDELNSQILSLRGNNHLLNFLIALFSPSVPDFRSFVLHFLLFCGVLCACL